jgi:hypothetical protein
MSQDYQFMAPPKAAPKAAPKKKPSGTSSKAKKPINVEIIEDDEEDKTIKRLLWTPDEDERLVSEQLEQFFSVLYIWLSLYLRKLLVHITDECLAQKLK